MACFCKIEIFQNKIQRQKTKPNRYVKQRLNPLKGKVGLGLDLWVGFRFINFISKHTQLWGGCRHLWFDM